jgi:hypothetical protein
VKRTVKAWAVLSIKFKPLGISSVSIRRPSYAADYKDSPEWAIVPCTITYDASRARGGSPMPDSVAQRLKALEDASEKTVVKRDPVSGDEYTVAAPAWIVAGWRDELSAIRAEVERLAKALRHDNALADEVSAALSTEKPSHG